MIVLFGHGSFTEHDALLSAQSLRAYAVGLPAFVMVKVLSPAFFARGDTRTPVYIGIGVLLLNFLLNLLFMKPLVHMGPPLASSLAACINVAVLAFLLRQKNALLLAPETLGGIGRVGLGAAVMAILLVGLETLLPLPAHFILRLLWLTVMVGVGGMFYAAMLHILGVMDLAELLAALRSRLNRKRR